MRDLINTRVVGLAISSNDIGRNILRNKSTALNHTVVTDMYPLVNSSMATDNYPVANLYLASQRHTVSDNAVATNNVVMCYVHVGHK